MKTIKNNSISRQKLAKQKSWLLNSLSILGVILFLTLLASCGYYYKVRDIDDISNPDTQAELNLKGKYVILRSSGLSKNFYQIIVKGDSMSGRLKNLEQYRSRYLYPKKKGGNRYKKQEETYIIDQVHIHLSNHSIDLTRNDVSFPLSSIQKVQVYKKDGAATAASWIIPPVLTIGIIAGLTAASSCPFVYTYDGENYHLAGEIYGGATYASLERHDYMSLPNFTPNEGIYQLKLSNELKEIQYTNFSELLLVRHTDNEKLSIDKYGEIQSYASPQAPQRATTTNGSDVTFSVRDKMDNLLFAFDDEGMDNNVNGLTMNFVNDKNVRKGKLIVRAKNSVWADYAYGKFSNLFGTYYDDWNNDQKKLSTKKMKKNAMEQDIPLSIYVETKKGWKFIDYYEVVGPIAYREMVIPVDLSNVKSNSVKIKLETGYKFWDLDYVAMDFTENIDVNYSKLQLISAIDENGRDVKTLISKDDKQYLIQPNIGNEVVFQYASPANTTLETQNLEISVFLHTKGYYERIRKYENNPDWISLISHKHNHAFSKYSYNEYMKAKEIKLLAMENQ